MDASTDTDAYKPPNRTESPPPPPPQEQPSVYLPKPNVPRQPPPRKFQTRPAPGGIDSAKIFGDFIADRLRQLSGLRRKVTENQLLRVVLEASEEEVSSGDSAIDNDEPFDDDDHYDQGPLDESIPQTVDSLGTGLGVGSNIPTTAEIDDRYPEDPHEITDAYSYEENPGGGGQISQDLVVGEPFPINLNESGKLSVRVQPSKKRKKRSHQSKYQSTRPQRQKKATAPANDTNTIVPDDPMTDDYSEIKIEPGDTGGALATWSPAYLGPSTSLPPQDLYDKVESSGAANPT